MSPKAERLLAKLRQPFEPDQNCGQAVNRNQTREISFLRATNTAQQRELIAYRTVIEDMVEEVGNLHYLLEQNHVEHLEDEAVREEVCRAVVGDLVLRSRSTDYMRVLVEVTEKLKSIYMAKRAEIAEPVIPPLRPD